MRRHAIFEPIETIRELKFKFLKEANFQTNRYTKQFRRVAKQILHKQKLQLYPMMIEETD